MRLISICLAIAGAASGLLAVWYWYQSSKVEIIPSWGNGVEPADGQLSQMGWQSGMMEAMTTTAQLNKTAACLTAISVLLFTASTIVGMFG